MFFCLYYVSVNLHSTSNTILLGNNRANIIAIVLSIVIIVFLGLRPVSGIAFIDMYMYNHSYLNVINSYVPINFYEEWLWDNFSFFCKELGLSNREYFLVIALFYFGFMVAACWRLMKNNLLLAVLFCFISFSCFTYGVNGLRNGMACSILMFAISLLDSHKWHHLMISFGLMVIAFGLHRSSILPAFCALTAFLFIKEPKSAFYFWGASLIISLVAGRQVTQFFSSLGFDERMEHYANIDEMGEIIESSTYNVGFRLDFLIYSVMPLIMVWYVTIKRNFKDNMYNIIATTYILANAFWVIVIRSEQSNRFAYLSWFLYPIVIAYPLLRMNIWEDQNKKTALILLAYSGFTVFMNFIYYGR